MSPLRLHFNLTLNESGTDRYRLENDDGRETNVVEFHSLQDAQRFAETAQLRSDEIVPLILVRNGIIADTNSFWLADISTWGTGGRFVTEEKMLVSCNSIRN